MKPGIVVVINDMLPQQLEEIGSLLKAVSANVTLVKRVSLSEQGPIGETTTEARLDLSEASGNLNISAAQQIVPGSSQSVLNRLMNGPIDGMIVGEPNTSLMLFIKNPTVPGMEKLTAQLPHKILSPKKSFTTSNPHKTISYENLFAKIHSLKSEKNKELPQDTIQHRI